MMTIQAELKKKAYASNLKSRALSILIYLIDRSNKELTCFPSISTMAKELHISVSTVKRALHELVDEGFIKKDMRFREKNCGQTSNLYTIIYQGNTQVQTQEKAPKCSPKVIHISFQNIIENVDMSKQDISEQKIKSNKKDIVRYYPSNHPIYNWQNRFGYKIMLKTICRTIKNLFVFSLYYMWTGEGVNLIPP